VPQKKRFKIMFKKNIKRSFQKKKMGRGIERKREKGKRYVHAILKNANA